MNASALLDDPLAERIREAYREPGRCPPPEWHHRAVIGEPPSAKDKWLAAHALACPACAAERDLAARFEAPLEGARAADIAFIVGRLESAAVWRGRARSATPGGGEVLPFPRLRRWTARPLTRWAAAAVLVLAVGGALQTLRTAPPPLPERPPGDVVRGAEIDVLAPEGVVGTVPAELRWVEVEGATGYRVILSAVDRTVLWEHRVDAPPAALPAEVIARLHRRVAYLWRVEALDSSETKIAWSELVRFEVRPE